MGNDLRNGRGRGGKSGGGNATGNANRLGKLKKARIRFDLSRLDTGKLLATLERAIVSGGALRVGLTRDGGALAVGVYGDGEYEVVYLNGDDDQDVFWDTIMEFYE